MKKTKRAEYYERRAECYERRARYYAIEKRAEYYQRRAEYYKRTASTDGLAQTVTKQRHIHGSILWMVSTRPSQ